MKRTEDMEKIIIGVLIGIGLCICAIALFLWVGFGGPDELRADLDKMSLPPPAEPSVKTAEIDFWIQYTVNGETMEIKDTLLCEYDGYSYNHSQHRNTRNWKCSFKSDSTAEHLVLYEWVETIGIETYAVVVELLPASYFMSDPDYAHRYQQVEYPFTIKVCDALKGYCGVGEEKTEELLDICGFEITDWTCDPPIENQFE